MEPSTFQIISSILFLLLIVAGVYMYRNMQKISNTKTGLFIPAGTIVMWDASAPPEGWAICDGSRGTPDLTGRFVVGAGMSSETGQEIIYTLHDKGGENAHSLTADENGPHTHTTAIGTWSHRYDSGVNSALNNPSTTGSSGLGKPHENRPPFVALTYIMKT